MSGQPIEHHDPYSSPPGPKGELRIPLANIPSMVKVMVLCLCALGLVFTLILPWVYLEMDIDDETVTASYDGKLQRMDSGEDDGARDNMRDALSDSGYFNAEEHYDRGLATAGFILLLIILGASVFLKLAAVLSRRVSGAVQVALSALALLPACMVTVAGMRFIGGFGIAYDSMLGAFDEDASVSAFGGLAIAAIGLFVIVLLVFELLRELRATSTGPAAGPWPWSGPFPQRAVLALVVLAIAGIITVPVTPWISVDPDDEDVGEFYQDEGLIHGQAEGSGVGSDELRDMRRDIRYASACFWLALIFAIVGVMAIALRNMGAPQTVAGPVMLVGAMGFLFPLFGLLSHVGFMGYMKELEIATVDTDLTFTAYTPMVFAFLLLLAALVFLAVVAREIRGGRPAAPPVGLAPAAPGEERMADVIHEEEASSPSKDPGLPVVTVGGQQVGAGDAPEDDEDDEEEGGEVDD